MNISYKWLKEYVDCSTSAPPQVGDALTSVDLEVDALEEVQVYAAASRASWWDRCSRAKPILILTIFTYDC